MISGRAIAIALVRAYQLLISPLKATIFGASSCCRFFPSCSCYAIDAFRSHGLMRGAFLSARRLLRCHPWGGSGADPVPLPTTNHASAANPARLHLPPHK